MRNLILLVLIISIFSVVSLNAGEKVKIFFKNGGHLSGEIIDSVPGLSIRIKPDDFPVMTYQTSEIARIVKYKDIIETKGIYGFGFGVQYGVLGIGLEWHSPYGHSSLFGGVGTTVLAGMGWSVGGRLYLNDFYSSFQPRLSVLYGTNSVLVIEKTDMFNLSSENDYEVGTGINIGAGFKWMFGETNSWGIDCDIFYIATTSLEERINELEYLGRIKNSDGPKIDIAFGFVFSF